MGKNNNETNHKPVASLATVINPYLSHARGYVKGDNEYTSILQYPYCVNYFEVSFNQMVRAWKDYKPNVIKSVIKSVAAEYFNSVDLSYIDSIFNAVKDTGEKSAELFALLVELWKRQNVNKYQDEQEVPVGRLFMVDPTNTVNPSHAPRVIYLANGTEPVTDHCGGWEISNAEWQRTFLDKLKHIYLGDQMKNQICFLVGNIFKLQRDDATLRLLDFVPKFSELGSGEDPHLIWDSKNNFIAHLENLVDTIQGYFNTYPMLSTIMRLLGWKSGSDFDFTRDLAQSTIHIYEDRYGDIEAMAYSVATGRTNENEDVTTTSTHGIYSVTTNVSNFKEHELQIAPRISISIDTLINILRKAVDHNDIVYMETNTNVTTNAFTYQFVRRYGNYINATADVPGMTMEKLSNYSETNATCAFLDVVGTADQESVIGFNEQGGTLTIRVARFGLSDYLMPVGDIDLVAGEASFNLMFADSEYQEIINNITNTVKTEGDK